MEFNQKNFKRFKKQIKSITGSKIQLGATGQSNAPGLSNAELLLVHEFGVPKKNIPARAPVRKTFRDKKNLKKIRDNLRGLLVKNFDKKKGFKIDKILSGVAETMRALLVTTIKRRLSPANTASTLARKRGDLPLIDTGRMVNSITSRVKRK